MKPKIYKNNHIGYILMFIIIILFIAYILYVYSQGCTSCKDCEGMTDSSACIPTQNRRFYLKTKHDKQIKNLYIDLSITQMRLDRNRLTSFYITKCLKNTEDISYLRYNPNIVDFTKAFTLIKSDDSMNINTVKDLTKSNERILFIKRANTNASNLVRLGIIINKKKYWFTTNNNNSWTQNIKKSNVFKIEYD
jgi:hypothetical protein